MKTTTTILLTVFAMIQMACKQDKPSVEQPGANYCIMQIAGQEWRADGGVSGGYHATEAVGPGVLAINAQKGEGSKQQDFVINLYNTAGPGTYTIHIPDGGKQATHQNVAQFANLTPSNYLCGGALQGSKLTVVVTKASKSPQEIEASFSGTMQCVEGNTLHITNGKFYYHE